MSQNCNHVKMDFHESNSKPDGTEGSDHSHSCNYIYLNVVSTATLWTFLPASGWVEGTKYSFNVTTSESGGLGIVYALKYAKGSNVVKGNSGDVGASMKTVVTWSSEIVPSSVGGDNFTLAAICGTNSKMYVAEKITLQKDSNSKKS